ncbi:MAG: hypothetical protein ACRDXB_19120, partial [Actinomycetes bacterium]
MRHLQRVVVGIVAAGVGCVGLVAWHQLQSDSERVADRTCRPRCAPMPIGDLPGWSQVFAEDFVTDVPVGEFPGTVYGDSWRSFEDGRPDTSGNGVHMPSKVLSVRNGVLDMFVHTEDRAHLVSAAIPKVPASAYGRYSVRFRADLLAGYKTAWLLAPDTNEIPGYPEIGWPEGNLDETMSARRRYAGPDAGGDRFATSAKFTDWHVATTTWEPGKVTFELDGRVVG